MGGASRAQSSDTDCSVLEQTCCLQGFVLHLPGLRTIKLEHPGEQGKSYLGASPTAASADPAGCTCLLQTPAREAVLAINSLAVLGVYYHCSFPKTEAASPELGLLACPRVPFACDIFSIIGTDQMRCLLLLSQH